MVRVGPLSRTTNPRLASPSFCHAVVTDQVRGPFFGGVWSVGSGIGAGIPYFATKENFASRLEAAAAGRGWRCVGRRRPGSLTPSRGVRNLRRALHFPPGTQT